MNIMRDLPFRNGTLLLALFFLSISVTIFLGGDRPSEAWLKEAQIQEGKNKGAVSLNLAKKNQNGNQDDELYFRKNEEAASVRQTLNRHGIQLENFPAYEVMATGYTAGYESTGKHPRDPEYGITYSGVKVRRDRFSTIAADLTRFPIGTVLYIPGYGYGVVADKGAAIKGNKVDLYFETVEDVYREWGKRKVKVYLIKRGDGTLTEEAMKRYNEGPDEVNIR